MIKGIVMIFLGLWFGPYLLPVAVSGIRQGDFSNWWLTALFIIAFVGMPVFFGARFIRRHNKKKREERELISRVDRGITG